MVRGFHDKRKKERKMRMSELDWYNIHICVYMYIRCGRLPFKENIFFKCYLRHAY